MIVRVEEAHIVEMSQSMQADDKAQFWSLRHEGPEEGLRSLIGRSIGVYAGLVDGELISIHGICHLSLLGRDVGPWLIGNERVQDNPVVFLRTSKVWIEALASQYRTLIAGIMVGNERQIRWLKWLGFEFSDPTALGVDGDLFYIAELRR